MKNLLKKIGKSLIVPAAAIGISGCAAYIQTSSLDKVADKSYYNKIGIDVTGIKNSFNVKSALMLADDLLHDFPLVRELTYNLDGSVKSDGFRLNESWGAKERAKFPDWKEKYKELAIEADQNNDGKISYHEACKVLSRVIEEKYPSSPQSEQQ